MIVYDIRSDDPGNYLAEINQTRDAMAASISTTVGWDRFERSLAFLDLYWFNQRGLVPDPFLLLYDDTDGLEFTYYLMDSHLPLSYFVYFLAKFSTTEYARITEDEYLISSIIEEIDARRRSDGFLPILDAAVNRPAVVQTMLALIALKDHPRGRRYIPAFIAAYMQEMEDAAPVTTTIGENSATPSSVSSVPAPEMTIPVKKSNAGRKPAPKSDRFWIEVCRLIFEGTNTADILSEQMKDWCNRNNMRIEPETVRGKITNLKIALRLRESQ